MPTPTDARVERNGDALVFAGALDRPAVAALWPAALAALDQVRRFDLRAVSHVDSAGLALLTELAAREGSTVALEGDPPGLAELRAAYRLAADLGFDS